MESQYYGWQWHSNAGGLGDTTFTKVFVGGLAWETQRETLKHYFEQFGEILEAVVITDRVTGRSKGYGFVTFKDNDSAFRACMDPSPIIDGRQANCNLAYIGARLSQHPTSDQGSCVYAPAARILAYHPQGASYSYPQGSQFTTNHIVSYPTYELIDYSQGNNYPMSYYNPYGYYQAIRTFPNAGMYQYYTQSSLQYSQMFPYTPQLQCGSYILSLPSIQSNTTGRSTAITTSTTTNQLAGGVNSDTTPPSL